MRLSSHLMLCAAASVFALSAHAATPLRASEVPKISNGGTGFIGITESAGTAWQPEKQLRATAAATSSVPIGAGEASTIVNGQPNRDPSAPSVGADSTKTMGGSAAPRTERDSRTGPRGSSATHLLWGTPD